MSILDLYGWFCTKGKTEREIIWLILPIYQYSQKKPISFTTLSVHICYHWHTNSISILVNRLSLKRWETGSLTGDRWRKSTANTPATRHATTRSSVNHTRKNEDDFCRSFSATVSAFCAWHGPPKKMWPIGNIAQFFGFVPSLYSRSVEI